MGTIRLVYRPALPLLLLAFGFMLSSAWGQLNEDPRLMSRPDLIIRVQKSPVGADYVTIQVVAENYPPELLREQCVRIGELAGGSSRGIEVTSVPTGTSPGGVPTMYLSASFATDNLIDRSKGILRLAPFAKAFAGNEEPFTIDCIAISFAEESPGPNTIGNVQNDSVSIEGEYDASRRIVDYRIYLLTQDPEKIVVPDSLAEQTIRKVAPSNGSAWRLIPWIAGGAVLAGLLVYFALRPVGKKPPAKPKERPR